MSKFPLCIIIIHNSLILIFLVVFLATTFTKVQNKSEHNIISKYEYVKVKNYKYCNKKITFITKTF